MSLSIKILGSNSASFAHNRHHTSQIVQVQNQLFMIDCGEGTQLQCKKYGIKLSKIDHIMISHLHGDHYYGLIGLLSTMHLYGRQKTLKLIGPPGLMEIISLQLRYSETTLNYDIDLVEWAPDARQLVFEDDRLTIHTIPLDHRVPCCGYLIREKEKKKRINKEAISERLSPDIVYKLKNGEDIINEDGSIRFKNKEVTLPPYPQYSYAFCSDTRLKREILSDISGVDIVYHEATFIEDMKERAHQTYHTTAGDAAQLAKDADAKMLLLGHFSTRYKNLDPVLAEAKEIFQNSYLATEGQTFSVNSQ